MGECNHRYQVLITKSRFFKFNHLQKIGPSQVEGSQFRMHQMVIKFVIMRL